MVGCSLTFSKIMIFSKPVCIKSFQTTELHVVKMIVATLVCCIGVYKCYGLF